MVVLSLQPNTTFPSKLIIILTIPPMNLINSQNHTHSVTNVSVPQISSEARNGYYFDGQMICNSQYLNQFGDFPMNACNNYSDCSGVAVFFTI